MCIHISQTKDFVLLEAEDDDFLDISTDDDSDNENDTLLSVLQQRQRLLHHIYDPQREIVDLTADDDNDSQNGNNEPTEPVEDITPGQDMETNSFVSLDDWVSAIPSSMELENDDIPLRESDIESLLSDSSPSSNNNNNNIQTEPVLYEIKSESIGLSDNVSVKDNDIVSASTTLSAWISVSESDIESDEDSKSSGNKEDQEITNDDTMEEYKNVTSSSGSEARKRRRSEDCDDHSEVSSSMTPVKMQRTDQQ